MTLAVTALVVALAGSALAGTPGKLSKLIDGTQIKPRSQPANRLKKDTLTGKQINEAKLGTVPSVAHATTATTATNATTADTAGTATDANSVGGATAADLKVRCRPGTALIGGGCVETGPPRAATAWPNAVLACAGRALPTVSQLLALHAADPSLTAVEMGGAIEVPDVENTVNMSTGAVGVTSTATSLAFRCVSDPVNF